MSADDVTRDPPYGSGTPLDAALFYAERGWPVFPCHSIREVRCSCGNRDCKHPGKHPRTEHGLTDAMTHAAAIKVWWSRWPDASIGIRTGGGFFVVDIDDRHDGDRTLADLEAKYGSLPDTPEVLTGGGGRHLYFATPAGIRIPTRAGIAPGIDVRAAGGYVIAPPSGHSSGRGYAWECQHHPLEIPLADPPAWMVTLVSQPTITTAASRPPDYWRALVCDGIDEGRRNQAVAQLAGLLLRRGVDPYVTLDLIAAWNGRRCRPPLTEQEVATTVDSIARREAARRGMLS